MGLRIKEAEVTCFHCCFMGEICTVNMLEGGKGKQRKEFEEKIKEKAMAAFCSKRQKEAKKQMDMEGKELRIPMKSESFHVCGARRHG